MSSSVECCHPEQQLPHGHVQQITSSAPPESHWHQSSEHLLHHHQLCPKSSANHRPQSGAGLLAHRFRFCLFLLLVNSETFPQSQRLISSSRHHCFPIRWHGHVKNSCCVTWSKTGMVMTGYSGHFTCLEGGESHIPRLAITDYSRPFTWRKWIKHPETGNDRLLKTIYMEEVNHASQDCSPWRTAVKALSSTKHCVKWTLGGNNITAATLLFTTLSWR